jgi:flagellar hook-length control protein FliK
MTLQAANLNPVNAHQAQTGKKQADAAMADTPFSQMLSNEIAQNKPVSETRSDSRQDVQPSSDSASTDSTDSKDDKDAVSADASTGDPLHPTPADNGAPQPDASLPTADASTMLPNAMLALAAAPTPLIPPPPQASTSSVAVAGAGAVVADVLAARQLIPLNGTAPPALQPAQAADASADAQAATSQQSVKADFQAAMTTATSAQTTAAAAASLPAQIAAALSGDSLKTDKTRTDGLNNPLMAVTPHTLLNTISAPASVASNALAPSVGSAAWGQALGEQIVWMTAGAQQTASLTLNPPNLGPLQIVLHVTNDQATASFFSAQPEVRHALEAALPKLREMMNDAGIQLGQTTVGAQTQQQQHESANREAWRGAPSYPGSGNGVDTGTQTLPIPIRQSGRGLVDTFA